MHFFTQERGGLRDVEKNTAGCIGQALPRTDKLLSV